MKMLMESWRKYLTEVSWSDGKDFDYPAKKQPKYAKDLQSNRVIIFDINDKYINTGNTHGGISHMIKHFDEFSPEQIKSATSSTIDLINQFEQDVYVTSGDGEPQPIKKNRISNGDIINTYDHINDKKNSGETLLDIEKQIYSQHIEPLFSQYDGMADSLMSNAIDVSNLQVKNTENLVNILSKNPVIYFKAIYWGTKAEMEYYVDTKTSAMIASDSGTVATFYRRSKQSPNEEISFMQSLKGFASNKRTVPTDEYSILRDYIDKQQPKKKRKIRIKPKNPVDFVKILISRNLSIDKIKNIIMKKNWRPDQREEALEFIKTYELQGDIQ